MPTPASPLVAVLIAAALASVHVLARRVRFLSAIPRSRWLSGAAGVSVAYVFVHILPDLAAGQRSVQAAVGRPWSAAERHVYVVALIGLGVFYGLERFVRRDQRRRGRPAADTAGDREPGPAAGGAAAFWVHVGSFAVLNFIIGYLLLHREEPGLKSLLTYGLAMGTHVLVNDAGLRADHAERYDRSGRWLLAVAVLAGAGVGAATELPKALVAVVFAFLAGGVVLNVLKEELPAERDSNFAAFAVGATVFAGLLLGA